VWDVLVDFPNFQLVMELWSTFGFIHGVVILVFRIGSLIFLHKDASVVSYLRGGWSWNPFFVNLF
jgi:hypothetical protein